ncbi:MAG: hypothetical protein J0H78_18460 [Rhizobiales bacterium]|nr:hypothetical protein [Hyphomicrobiales bacterium]OJY44737.1 MAG: hypothetical protein BGP08_00080 [Rhizobiales bacterium 64-17]
MRLMVVYALLVIVGEIAAVELGLYLDAVVPSFSLPIALALFFSVLVVMWPAAVFITERWLMGKGADAARA